MGVAGRWILDIGSCGDPGLGYWGVPGRGRIAVHGTRPYGCIAARACRAHASPRASIGRRLIQSRLIRSIISEFQTQVFHGRGHMYNRGRRVGCSRRQPPKKNKRKREDIGYWQGGEPGYWILANSPGSKILYQGPNLSENKRSLPLRRGWIVEQFLCTYSSRQPCHRESGTANRAQSVRCARSHLQ